LVTKVGPSNRGVPNDERFVVTYTPGHDLLVTWAINNGNTGETPTGTPTCTAPPTDPVTTTTTTTTAPGGEVTTTTTTTLPKQRTTPQESRQEAKEILQSIKPQINGLHLDITGVQLVGTYPIEGASDDDVVQVLYSKATVLGNLPSYLKMFDVPPAEVVQCLNPAFELS